MNKNYITVENNKLNELCKQVKVLENNGESEMCYRLIIEEMKNFPHAPQPHNLLGMLLEKKGDHILAMRHFRAAWSLDPTYLPARYNLEVYGTFCSHGTGAYEEEDCPTLKEENKYIIQYDENKVGHLVRRSRHENK